MMCGTPPPPVPWLNFYTSNVFVKALETVTITWTSGNTTWANIDGRGVPLNGSEPLSSKFYTYRQCNVGGDGGQISAGIEYKPAPWIEYFNIAQSPVSAMKNTAIGWKIEGANAVYINNIQQ
jgi:hypothetical protein